jgi:DNA-binding FadR family transcriptional regulator
MATRASKPIASSSDEAVATSAAEPVPGPAPRRGGLHVPKAPEIVADRIRKRIVSGSLKVGELLPPEGRLMEEFGVSRPTIREAFRILEAQRLITVSRGARGGALVHAPDPDLISMYTLLVLQAERTTVAEVFDTRRLIEPPLAREVALRGPADAPQQLQARLDAERATVDDIAAFNLAINAFHDTLIALSGNRPLIHLMAAITDVIARHQTMVMQRSRHTQPRSETVASYEAAFRSQKKLIDLIARRDGAAAEAHWLKHTEITHRLFVSEFEQLTIHELLTE